MHQSTHPTLTSNPDNTSGQHTFIINQLNTIYDYDYPLNPITILSILSQYTQSQHHTNNRNQHILSTYPVNRRECGWCWMTRTPSQPPPSSYLSLLQTTMRLSHLQQQRQHHHQHHHLSSILFLRARLSIAPTTPAPSPLPLPPPAPPPLLVATRKLSIWGSVVSYDSDDYL